MRSSSRPFPSPVRARMALCVAALACAGCMDATFHSLQPGSLVGEAYEPFVADLLDPVRASQWVWVRGRAVGEAEGFDRQHGEEIVVVTLQEGDPSNPGPIQTAVALACRRPPGRDPVLLARHRIYDAAVGLPNARYPADIVAPSAPPGPFTHARAVITRPDLETRRGFVALSLWREDGDSPKKTVYAYHKLLDLERLPPPAREAPQTPDRQDVVTVADAGAAATRPPDAEEPAGRGRHAATFRFRECFETLAVQSDPAMRVQDINRDGYLDIIVNMRVLPDWTREIADFAEPEWPVVWMGDTPSSFKALSPQDAVAQNIPPRVYAQLNESWYQAYAEALAQKQAPERLAYFAYYLSRQHLYEGAVELSRRRLDEAERLSGDPAMREPIRATRALLEEMATVTK